MDFWPSINASRILIVESDVNLADALHDMLVAENYYVQKAYNLGDARFSVRHHHYDVALVDLRVSDTDGQSAADVFQKDPAFEYVTWIAISTSPAKVMPPEGASGMITAPIHTQAVLNVVAQTLERVKLKPANLSNMPEMTSRDELLKLLERNLLEQQTLSGIARMLNSTLDLNTVLTKVVDAATSLTNAEEGLLLLPDDEGKTLYIRAAKGIDHETAREFRIKTQDTLAGHVFQTGNPVLVGRAGWQKVKTQYFARSLLYVPMQVKGQNVGVLGVNNRMTDRTFTERDRELLQDLASHAAIAIENARLYGESVMRSRELATLVNASIAVNTTLSLEVVLPTIGEQFIHALNISLCELATIDGGTGTLRVISRYIQGHWSPEHSPQLNPLQVTVFRHSLEQRQAMVLGLEELVNDKVNYQYLSGQQAQKLCLIPVFSNNQPQGVVELIYHHRHSDPVISADWEEKSHHLLTMALNNQDDFIEQKELAWSLAKTAEANVCNVWRWDPIYKMLRQLLSVGKGVWLASPSPMLNFNKLKLLRRTVLHSETVEITANAQLDPDEAVLLDFYHAQGLLVLPLMITGQVVGVVVLADTLSKRTFAKREFKLAQALVLQAGNALQNARLYNDLETSLQKLRKAQTQLVQAARMSAMGELAAAVAHQINNPLTTILGDTEILLQDSPEGDPSHEALQAIHRAGQRAHEVVRRLLSMAYRDRESEHLEPMDVNITIRNTLALVTSHIERGFIALTADLADNLPIINGLRGQMEDVWLNLLLNARDAVMEQDTRKIGIMSCLDPDGIIRVEVWDNGPGIPDEERETIFDAFYTTKQPGQGTGLGLHISRQIVEKCGGQISAEKPENGKAGARFVVLLPALEK